MNPSEFREMHDTCEINKQLQALFRLMEASILKAESIIVTLQDPCKYRADPHMTCISENMLLGLHASLQSYLTSEAFVHNELEMRKQR